VSIERNKHHAVKTRVFAAIVILSNVLGNLALSWGLKHYGLFSPYVFLGVALLIVWLLSRMTLLSWADLSYVLPVTSVGYVLTVFLGKYFFAEQITWQRWLGSLLIVGGMIVVGRTYPASLNHSKVNPA
jgi:uncharacterized membrane protein